MDTIRNTAVFTVSGRASEAMQMQSMTLFVFSDQFRSVLLATCRVEVHARSVIYSRTKIKHRSQHTLTLPANQARSVRIFSNKPLNVFQKEDVQGKVINLLPASINYIQVFAEFDEPSKLLTPTLVNAVDTATYELVHSWMLIMETVA